VCTHIYTYNIKHEEMLYMHVFSPEKGKTIQLYTS